MKKRALITGVTGQDGSYLAELLLSKGYEVFGLVRRTSQPAVVVDGVRVITGDMTDQGSLNRAMIEATPDEIYNLAAQSFVGASWDIPVETAEVTGLGTLRLLEATRLYNPRAKFYQASSSEMFGNQSGILNEESTFMPRSPYGFAKVFAHHAAVNYRESFGMFVSCGILFNHESPRRGNEFVTKKIINAVKEGHPVRLGNVAVRRDWGYAPDYVDAMWRMLQQDNPDDYIIATGKSTSVREFAELAGASVVIDPTLFRPTEIMDFRADTTKASTKLGWYPKTGVEDLIGVMLAG